MNVGFAKRIITPKIGCALAGYALPGRLAEGVHDDLYARALVFKCGNKPTVILQLDVLYLDNLCMERILERLGRLGIHREQLLVCCSHTHSSFGGIFDVSRGLNSQMKDLFGETDGTLVDILAEKSAHAVQEALGDMAPAKIRMLNDKISGVGANRHDPDIKSDQDIFIAEFLRDDGKKAVLYNLSCHPTVLNGQNRMISADFVGAADSILLEVGYDMAMFINGSCGDMSTRFTRRGSSFEECTRIGGIVAEKVIDMSKSPKQPQPLENATLKYHELYIKEAEIEGREPASIKLDEAVRRLEEVRTQTNDRAAVRKAESFVEGAAVNLMKAKYLQGYAASEQAVEVGILELNEKKIVCSPFELFSTLALKLKGQKHVEMFGYVNASYGYLADREAYQNLDYEAMFSAFAAGQGESYIEQATQLL